MRAWPWRWQQRQPAVETSNTLYYIQNFRLKYNTSEFRIIINCL
jgi:hypothetical protein